MVVIAIATWFAGYVAVMTIVTARAPSAAVDSPVPISDPRSAKAPPIRLADLHEYASVNLQPVNANAADFARKSRAKSYYDWYTQWYLSISLVFLASVIAFFLGNALNGTLVPQPKEGASDANVPGADGRSSPTKEGGQGTNSAFKDAAAVVGLPNYLAILTLALSAIGAMSGFMVNEYFKLFDFAHHAVNFNFLGSNEIEPGRWAEGSNIFRLFWDNVGLPRNFYFCAFDIAIIASSVLPLLIGLEIASDILKLAATKVQYFGRVIFESAETLIRLVTGIIQDVTDLKAQRDTAESELVGQREKLEALQKQYNDTLEQLSDAKRVDADLGCQIARKSDLKTILAEYIKDIKLKREEIEGKATDGGQSWASSSATDTSLHQAKTSLLKCELELAAAVQTLENEIQELTERRDQNAKHKVNLQQTQSSLKGAMEPIKAQIETLLKQIGNLSGRITSAEAQIQQLTAEIEVRKSRLETPFTYIGEVTLEHPNDQVPHPSDAAAKAPAKRSSWATAWDIVKYWLLAILAIALLIVGNWAMSPDLHADSESWLVQSIGSYAFLSINLLLGAILLVNGLVMNWAAAPFFAARGKAAARLGLYLLALAGGAAAVWVLLLCPFIHIGTPPLPNSLGVAHLDCAVAGGDETQANNLLPSGFVFDSSRFIRIDTLDSRCKLTSIDPTKVNYYIIVGSASMEGPDNLAGALGDERALNLYRKISDQIKSEGDEAHTTLPIKVYGLNLGQYDPLPSDKAAIEARQMRDQAAKEKDPIQKQRLLRAAEDMTAYQRKFVVLAGFSSHLALAQEHEKLKKGEMAEKDLVTKEYRAFRSELDQKLCRQAGYSQEAASVLQIDPARYKIIDPKATPVCDGPNLHLVDDSTLSQEIPILDPHNKR